MPVSTNPDFIQTAGQLMLSAAMELGAVGMGDELEASEADEMRKRLNMMLGKWSRDMNLWRIHSARITLAAGAAAATLPSEVKDIRTVRHIVSTTNKRMLQQWNRDEYFRLPNRASTGNPVAFYYQQRGQDGDEIYFWPIPTVQTTYELDYNRQFYFVESNDQDLDIPVEWLEAALYGLAARCANLFDATRLDPNKVQLIVGQSKASYDDLLDKDRPDSYYFEWDSPVEAGG